MGSCHHVITSHVPGIHQLTELTLKLYMFFRKGIKIPNTTQLFIGGASTIKPFEIQSCHKNPTFAKLW